MILGALQKVWEVMTRDYCETCRNTGVLVNPEINISADCPDCGKEYYQYQ